jgi:hypothetical protein
MAIIIINTILSFHNLTKTNKVLHVSVAEQGVQLLVKQMLKAHMVKKLLKKQLSMKRLIKPVE